MSTLLAGGFKVKGNSQLAASSGYLGASHAVRKARTHTGGTGRRNRQQSAVGMRPPPGRGGPGGPASAGSHGGAGHRPAAASMGGTHRHPAGDRFGAGATARQRLR